MPSAIAPDSTSTSGIATSADGERHIPASTRADGSVRKEIKVRPGYRPPEDVEVYKNRTAEAWKTRGKGGVPGAQFIQAEKQKESKTKAKKPKAPATTTATAASSNAATSSPTSAPQSQNGAQPTGSPQQEPAAEPVDPEEEKEKQARKLSKKLRQAKDLAQKKENGESLLPEQFEKVIRINELTRQLDNLGFDSEGHKKT